MKYYNAFMVFDVESIGLHGEGFAVGFVVVAPDGTELDSGAYSCLPDMALGDIPGRAWIVENVPAMEPTHGTPRQVRDAFWTKWREWADKGAALVADCAWPVEARFLCACVDQDSMNRAWSGPYPLHDLASVLFAAGMDPNATYPRLDNELPAHHPLADARQSARLFVEALPMAASLA